MASVLFNIPRASFSHHFSFPNEFNLVFKKMTDDATIYKIIKEKPKKMNKKRIENLPFYIRHDERRSQIGGIGQAQGGHNKTARASSSGVDVVVRLLFCVLLGCARIVLSLVSFHTRTHRHKHKQFLRIYFIFCSCGASRQFIRRRFAHTHTHTDADSLENVFLLSFPFFKKKKIILVQGHDGLERKATKSLGESNICRRFDANCCCESWIKEKG